MAGLLDAYKRTFTSEATAGLLSRPNPVRRTGFDVWLRIDARVIEAEDVVSLTLRSPAGADLPSWIPGAHLDVFLPSGRQRQYSLTGDPADRTTYRIAVRYLADGDGGSREMHDDLREGDLLRIRGPRNAFTYIDAPEYLFVAGGIGITPILPMVTECARRGAPWRLIYLGRSRASMPFLHELERCRGGTLEVRPDDEFGGPDLDALVAEAPRGAAVYVCGPPPLMESARRVLSATDPTASVHTERFSPLPVQDGDPFRITLRRSGTTVDVGGDESALSAILRAVPGAAFSCRQGFCGTCKTRVLAGEIDHRDRLLPDSDRDSAMLTCVSRALGDDLVLDL
ncbi:PDR/VanB family oxidoreductase [Nocardia lijiangensis]|uniref:PDR/VanB family oxidoreductase n=1 Tax=Nocardia lijiangensis TaxID=299618 RepID=UPI00082ABBA5|nr:PDR/VanB family oxidoreductase [Nocardia lijiangensis]